MQATDMQQRPATGQVSTAVAAARLSRQLRAALLMALLGVAITCGLLWRVTANLRDEGRMNVVVEAERVAGEIESRMNVFSAILASGAGMFHASEHVSHEDWYAFASALEMSRNYPGVQALAYSERVGPQERAAFEVRRSVELGRPFAIRAAPPAQPRTGDHFPVMFVEPDTVRNRGTIGFDLYSESSRRTTMQGAAGSGEPRLSAPIMLVQEGRDGAPQPGVIMFMPVYERGMPMGSAEQRQAALRGFVHAAFRTHDLMRSILRSRASNIGMELADTSVDTGKRLYTQAGLAAAATYTQAHVAVPANGHVVNRDIALGGRTWQARFTAPWDFGIAHARAQQAIVLLCGLLITALAALATWSLVRTRETALRLARKMNLELSSTQSRFERMVGGTSDGVWEINLTTSAVYCSPRCAHLLGWQPGKMSLQSALVRVDPRDRDRVQREFNACVKGRTELDTKLRVNAGHSLGTMRWYRLRAGVNQAAGGDLYVSGSLSDIQAQEEAQEREDRLLRVIESSPDIALTFNPEGHVTYLNAAARRAFAVDTDNGPDMTRAHAFAADELSRLAMRGSRKPHGGAEEAGTPGVIWQGETELQLPDGVLPMSQVVVCHSDTGGTALYYSAVMRDISPRRQVEAALKEAQARYGRALAGANDGIWEFSPLTGSFFCSERMEDLLGVAPGRGPRTSLGFRALIHPDDLQVHVDAVSGLMNTARTHTWDLRMCCGDNTWRWMRMRGMATFNQRGEPVLNSGTMTGIHEAKLAEEELRLHRDDLAGMVAERTASAEAARSEAERARVAAETANLSKSEFLANMSHELRTPMHAILSFASFGVEKAPRVERDKLSRYFANIQKSGQRLLSLLNDLLDLSKLEAGKMEMQLQDTDPAMVMREAIVEAEALAGEHGVRLELQLPAQGLRAQLDASRMLQVLRNLLSNAIKFSPRDARVVLELREVCDHSGDSGDSGEKCVEMVVRDEGVGIPEGELEAVFDKFVQSSKTKTGAGGTGLGLAICREIMQAHGGTIDAANNPPPQRGASFRIHLPVSLPAGERASAESAELA